MSATVDLGTVFKGTPSGKIIEAKGGTRQLRPNDVVIDIVYSGLCGTDLHYRKADTSSVTRVWVSSRKWVRRCGTSR